MIMFNCLIAVVGFEAGVLTGFISSKIAQWLIDCYMSRFYTSTALRGEGREDRKPRGRGIIMGQLIAA